jgi:hypothetical protein
MNITEALIWEAKSILKDGNKIDHPIWGSKDICDSLAILNWDLMHLEVKEGAGIDRIDLLTEEKLKSYCTQYVTEEHRLLSIETPPELMKKLIGERLRLSPDQTEKLAVYVNEHFNW